MADWFHPSLEQVLEIHLKVLAQHGGADGLRDLNLLQSALAAPKASMFGQPLLNDPVEIVAAYLFYLCKNHPFIDGNKRVSLATALVFLRVNGFSTAPDGPVWEELTLAVASGELTREAATERLRALVKG
ncbi:MAG: type II toxin-antitoxin system death-on-curing family toxin [Opitutales bacterium]|nr:type II toxin-antitoxin system death-on-curing family toxin [Opitutales bacterium]